MVFSGAFEDASDFSDTLSCKTKKDGSGSTNQRKNERERREREREIEGGTSAKREETVRETRRQKKKAARLDTHGRLVADRDDNYLWKAKEARQDLRHSPPSGARWATGLTPPVFSFPTDVHLFVVVGTSTRTSCWLGADRAARPCNCGTASEVWQPLWGEVVP